MRKNLIEFRKKCEKMRSVYYKAEVFNGMVKELEYMLEGVKGVDTERLRIHSDQFQIEEHRYDLIDKRDSLLKKQEYCNEYINTINNVINECSTTYKPFVNQMYLGNRKDKQLNELYPNMQNKVNNELVKHVKPDELLYLDQLEKEIFDTPRQFC